ncbi:MAG: hypothetical protein IPP29_09425 [Bacteroidetes bacterium]|nr:hypothetical protein [Bacteroidota bacterium]
MPPNIILLLRTNCNPNKNTKVEDIQYGMDYFDSSANKMFELNAIRKFSTARKLKRKRPFEIFYTNGNLGAKGAFKNGKPIGMWQFFFDNGKIKTVNIYDKKARLTSKNISYEYGYQDTVPSKINYIEYKKGKYDGSTQFERDTTNYFLKYEFKEYKKGTTSYGTSTSYFPNGFLESKQIQIVQNSDRPVNITLVITENYYPDGKIKMKKAVLDNVEMYIENYDDFGKKIVPEPQE